MSVKWTEGEGAKGEGSPVTLGGEGVVGRLDVLSPTCLHSIPVSSSRGVEEGKENLQRFRSEVFR